MAPVLESLGFLANAIADGFHQHLVRNLLPLADVGVELHEASTARPVADVELLAQIVGPEFRVQHGRAAMGR